MTLLNNFLPLSLNCKNIAYFHACKKGAILYLTIYLTIEPRVVRANVYRRKQYEKEKDFIKFNSGYLNVDVDLYGMHNETVNG